MTSPSPAEPKAEVQRMPEVPQDIADAITALWNDVFDFALDRKMTDAKREAMLLDEAPAELALRAAILTALRKNEERLAKAEKVVEAARSCRDEEDGIHDPACNVCTAIAAYDKVRTK